MKKLLTAKYLLGLLTRAPQSYYQISPDVTLSVLYKITGKIVEPGVIEIDSEVLEKERYGELEYKYADKEVVDLICGELKYYIKRIRGGIKIIYREHTFTKEE